MPWRSSITNVRQNIHWQAVVDGYTRILRAFAEDEIAKRTPSPDVITVADMAMKELKRVEDGSSRFVTYMYPFASEHRARLLAEMQCLSLLFDESWEHHEHDHNQTFFLSLMPPINNEDLHPKTPLQETVWKSIAAVYEEDERVGGNGGTGLIEFLTNYIKHPTPVKDFKTFTDFMDYRFNDGGMMVCWNSAKFSIGSNLSLQEPKMARIIRLLSEQMLESNDIASFDKEKKHWLAGNAKQFLTTNGTAIIRDLFALKSDEAAKALAYANQMETERQIDRELGDFLSTGQLSADEWHLVNAMLYCVTGNLISAVTMCRYGGQGARITTAEKGLNVTELGAAGMWPVILLCSAGVALASQRYLGYQSLLVYPLINNSVIPHVTLSYRLLFLY
ncbi:isoprenoid synthase domain-containing protein [Aspergillus pseudocaelatus]|uniref:Isoprenoid synthase domain-containing protein n=1 Tax=Aspergillus pseudocaelatus TaxID=1825620 RepID=A0ABQ6WRX7_9EURO|nr:isoprenoid synthase domain-containing protein [Aspergillus pseudocaelatus]